MGPSVPADTVSDTAADTVVAPAANSRLVGDMTCLVPENIVVGGMGPAVGAGWVATEECSLRNCPILFQMNPYDTNDPWIVNHRQSSHRCPRQHIPHPQPEETGWFLPPMVMVASGFEPKTHHQGQVDTDLPVR